MRPTLAAAAGAVAVASLVAALLTTTAAQETRPDAGPVGGNLVAATAGDRAADDEIADVAVPAAATVAGPTLVAASFNVCKVDCAAPAPSWDIRRDRVARVINESGADVIGLQEATNNPTAFARTQAQDIVNLAAAGGYRAVDFPDEANECRRPRDDNGRLAGPSPCDNTAMLLYRGSTVRQVQLTGGRPSGGVLLTSSIAPGVDPESGRRSVAWAYLEGTAGAGPILAVSLHTDSAKTAQAEAARVAIGTALGPWSDEWNIQHGMSGAPVVLMADLNSYRKRQPAGVQQVLADSGWVDAAQAPTKRNVQFSTINYNPLLPLNEQGFPVKPYEFRTSKKKPVLDATRIDYVMGRGAGVVPLDYEVVIRLNADGTFATEYQASDHQMVRATLSFPPR